MREPEFTVGCVSYVNAIPLVMRFQDWGDESPVRVIYNVPSRLPALLDSGVAQAALVSSIDALRVTGRRMADGVCIGSHGPVKSVRLFSKVPPTEIRSLAHDAHSMTSNRLAQVVLHDAYGVTPSVQVMEPHLESMLAQADACVLIGDIGMAADGAGLHVLDLGEEWRRLTGKPLVWAAWIGGEALSPELAMWLLAGSGQAYVGRRVDQEGWRSSLARKLLKGWYRELDETIETHSEPVITRLIERAVAHAHWDPAVIRDYYMNVMVYDMGESMVEGLREFRRRLLANGFADCSHFPEIVVPDGIMAFRSGM